MAFRNAELGGKTIKEMKKVITITLKYWEMTTITLKHYNIKNGGMGHMEGPFG